MRREGEVHVGCRDHPPFGTPEKRPDGMMPEFTGDPPDFCEVAAFYRGSFTRPGANEIVVAFDTCHDGDSGWNSAVPGSAVVLEEVAGSYREQLYQNAVNLAPDLGRATPARDTPTDARGKPTTWAAKYEYPAGCNLVRHETGRDVLVCASNFGAFSLGSMTYFFDVDFGRPPPYARTFVRLSEEVDVCARMRDMPDDTTTGFAIVEVARRTFADTDGDGTLDFRVDVVRAGSAASPRSITRVRAACAVGGSLRRILPPPVRTTLTFLSTSDGFEASEATKRTLQRWDAERGEVGGIAGAAPH